MKKTILIFIDWFSPAFKAGGPIVSISNLIENYSENINYKIICSNMDLDKTPLVGVKTNCWTTYNKNTQVWYSPNNRSFYQIIQLIRESNPDVIFINGIYSFYFNVIPMLFGKARKIVISPRGMLHPGSLSVKPFKKKIFITFIKILKIPEKVLFHATNTLEKNFVIKLFKNAKVNIAENFPRKLGISPFHFKAEMHLKMVTIALISPTKNYDKVLTALLGTKNFIIYNIYGPVKDLKYWKLCQQIIRLLPKNVIVNYYGEISPNQLTSIFSDNDIYIQPSKSENYGHSLFEALSAGKPVITSKGTPWNKLEEAFAGMNIDAEQTDEIKNAIDYFALLNDKDFKYWNIGSSKYSQEAIDLNKIKKEYEELFSF